MTNSKSLIAYFSRKGNNYVGGSIVNLPIGNTEEGFDLVPISMALNSYVNIFNIYGRS
jgi:hypothetical protein